MELLLLYSIVFLGVSEIIFGAVASFYMYQLSQYDPLSPNNVSGPAAMIISISIAVICISTFGWQGAKYRCRIHIIIFSYVLLILSFISVAVVVWAFIISENVTIHRQDLIEVKQDFQYLTQTFDYIQEELHCCGVGGAFEYLHKDYPKSCSDFSQPPKVIFRGCAFEVLKHSRSVLENVFRLSICAAVLRAIAHLISFSYLRNTKDRCSKNKSLDATNSRVAPPIITLSHKNDALTSLEKSTLEMTNQN